MAKQVFMVNPRGKRRRKTTARKTSRRRTTATRKGVPAWVRKRGFSSWAAYMASIRPSKGGKVAKRRRRRASSSRPATTTRRRRRRSYRRNSPVTMRANPRRRSRRSYRRNPSLSVRNIPSMVMAGATAAVGVLAGKAGVRVGRSALKIAGGTPVGYAAEIAIGVAGAIVLQKVSRNLATNFLTGAFVSVGEGLARTVNIPVVSAALGDEGQGTLNLISGEDDMSNLLQSGSRGEGSYDISPNVGSYDLREA